MASRAPLVLAAAFFVLGIAGLVQTVRQTSNGAAPTPLSALVIRSLAAPSPSMSPESNVSPVEGLSDEAVADTPAPVPSDPPTRPATAVLATVAKETAPVATQESAPAQDGGAIAVAVASDGDAIIPAIATTTLLHPLRFGMVGRDADGETPAAATIP